MMPFKKRGTTQPLALVGLTRRRPGATLGGFSTIRLPGGVKNPLPKLSAVWVLAHGSDGAVSISGTADGKVWCTRSKLHRLAPSSCASSLLTNGLSTYVIYGLWLQEVQSPSPRWVKPPTIASRAASSRLMADRIRVARQRTQKSTCIVVFGTWQPSAVLNGHALWNYAQVCYT